MKPKEIKVGQLVIYYGIISNFGVKSDPFETVVMEEPWKLGSGEWVCRVKGKRGGVSIKHLEPRK